MKRFFSILLALVMALSLTSAMSVQADATPVPVSYLDKDGATKKCEQYTRITSSSYFEEEDGKLNAGWYVLSGGTKAQPIEVYGIHITGDVHIILEDGCCYLFWGCEGYAAVQVSGSNNKLTIYAQSSGSDAGTLIAEAYVEDGGAGIGGNDGECFYTTRDSGKITINGGNIKAYGGYGAGIGGGSEEGVGSNITINGGTIESYGGYGAGIGGGSGGVGSNITINGGTIKAVGGGGSAGIGGGCYGEGNDITINGGNIEATGSNCDSFLSDNGGAGIGGGFWGIGSDITINGGNVKAAGGYGGAGIGNGARTEDPASNIKVNTALFLKQGDDAAHAVDVQNDGGDLAETLTGYYVEIEAPHSHNNIIFDQELTANGSAIVYNNNVANVYLTSDVTLTTLITVLPGKTLNLCLNGHILSGGSLGAVLTVRAGTLNIYDCGNAKHIWVPREDGLWVRNDSFNTAEKTLNKDYYITTGGVVTGGKSQFGGGIFNYDSKLTVYGGNIVGNYSPQLGGGVMSMYQSLEGFTTIKSSVLIAGNVAVYGGGIMNQVSTGAGRLTLEQGASVSYNTVTGTNVFGGGIFNSKGTLTIAGNVTNNLATGTSNGGGGGIYNSQGTLTITGNVTNNRATGTISGGGGIYSYYGKLDIAGKVTDNQTTGTKCNGGGIDSEWSSITLTGSVSNNRALGKAESNGGGIYCCTDEAVVTIKASAEIKGNKALQGGGIFNEPYWKGSEEEGWTIAENSGRLIIEEGASISSNTATTEGSDEKEAYGGGIYNHGGILTLAGKVTDNQALGAMSYGGGIYTYTDTVGSTTIQGSAEIKGNKAVNGGGILNTTDWIGSEEEGWTVETNAGRLTVEEGASISANTATTEGSEVQKAFGGGIYHDGGILIVAGKVTDNQALGAISYGGGIYTYNDAVGSTTIRGSAEIKGNKALLGGGLYNDTEWIYNETDGRWTVLKGAGSLTVEEGASISANTATTEGTNEQAAFGGGIYNNGGILTLAGKVTDNQALGAMSYGGGIYTYTDTVGSTTIQGSAEIKGNKALHGGGLYNDTEWTYNETDSRWTVLKGGGSLTVKEGASISSNTAEGYGGGIYNNGGTLTLSGNITGNSSTVGYPVGGIYTWQGDICLKGDVKITGNTDTYNSETVNSNLALSNDSDYTRVTLDNLTEEALIGITTMLYDEEEDCEIAGAYPFTVAGTYTAADRKCFTSDDPAYVVNYNNSGTTENLTDDYLELHAHALTYGTSKSVSTLDENDTITATCTDSCSATDRTLILKASNVTYDGNAHGALRVAALTDTTEAASFCGTTLPVISYEEYNGSSWDSISDTPKAAGVYRASVTVGEGVAAKTVYAKYTISKATPTVSTDPTASGITYGQTLADSTLTGGTATVDGSFAWKDGTTAPAVSDSNATGYTVVFTPDDTANYNAVEFTVTLAVSEATPTVSTAPTASGITYGQTLADSTLTGGTATVTGSFAWKDGTIAPAVSDSNTTEYTVVFTPDDTANYNAVEFKVTLAVSKAQVEVPAAEAGLVYNGSTQTGVVLPEGAVYTLSGNQQTGAGEYVATASLTDPANYEWKLDTPTSEDQSIEWSIAKAANTFTGTLTCADITESGTPAPSGVTAEFGNDRCIYLYSVEGSETWGTWDSINTGEGQYRVKAVVIEADDYYGCESDSVTFTVKSDRIIDRIQNAVEEIVQQVTQKVTTVLKKIFPRWF